MAYFPIVKGHDVTPDTLNSLMEFDRIIRVLPDGIVVDSPVSAYFDDACDELDDDGSVIDLTGGGISGIPDGWELLSGFSGQYSYNGPDFHQSESIGGGLARHILATPGDYVALVAKGGRVNGYADFVEDGWLERDDDYGYAWWIAYRPLG